MNLTRVYVSEEQQAIQEFADLSYKYYGCSSILKEQMENLADKISDYVPEDKEEFVKSDQYGIYRAWIRDYFIRRYADEHQKVVLQLTDPKEIRALPDEDKCLRKKLSDRVSDALRKMKNQIYPQRKNVYYCTICDLEITRLDLRCLTCLKHFHLRCLQNEQFICYNCRNNFYETAVITLPLHF
jgi:ribosomal protein L37AE/L43A